MSGSDGKCVIIDGIAWRVTDQFDDTPNSDDMNALAELGRALRSKLAEREGDHGEGERSARKRQKRPGRGSCGYCGKQTYDSRADARRVARTAHHGDSGLAAYECPDAKLAGFAGMWHIGHLNKMVKHGDYHRYSMPQSQRSPGQ